MNAEEAKYDALMRILDAISGEAPRSHKTFSPDRWDTDRRQLARSRAYLHLFLKVRFGLLNFKEREFYITDGGSDGGIDAFYIDKTTLTILCLQAKLPSTARNFSKSQLSLDELAKIQLKRITEGEKIDIESKRPYNEHIRRFQATLRKLKDISKYSYKIAILGNTSNLKEAHLAKICDGHNVERLDHSYSYMKLVFPVVQAAYYKNPDLVVSISHRHVKDKKDYLDYTVKTKEQNTNVKLVFVPTEEIGRILFQYKNSILRYNPRSFLELQNNSVNREIRDTIVRRQLNEFALFNNGITVVADGCHINPRIGKKGWARMEITNPHLVNGGQTAYVLSEIYEDVERGTLANDIFDDKEVLLRVVTLGPETTRQSPRAKLIDLVSRASNSQSKVDEADRRSNEPLQLALQDDFFFRHGMFYERKRGEFSDGLKSNYIRKDQLVRRDYLMRIALAVDGRIALAKSGIKKFFTVDGFQNSPLRIQEIPRYVYGYAALRRILQLRRDKANRGPKGLRKFGNAISHGQYALVSVVVNKAMKLNLEPIAAIDQLLSQWKRFESAMEKRRSNTKYFGKLTGGRFVSYYKGTTVDADVGNHSFNFKRKS